jgi:hypothetical protein
LDQPGGDNQPVPIPPGGFSPWLCGFFAAVGAVSFSILTLVAIGWAAWLVIKTRGVFGVSSLVFAVLMLVVGLLLRLAMRPG